jgi:hypothetical protein
MMVRRHIEVGVHDDAGTKAACGWMTAKRLLLSWNVSVRCFFLFVGLKVGLPLHIVTLWWMS